MVTPDETGWRVDAARHWPWAFATPETTVCSIRAGRGFADAAAAPGADFVGVLVRDGWVAYRGFKHAPHQTCLADQHRRVIERDPLPGAEALEVLDLQVGGSAASRAPPVASQLAGGPEIAESVLLHPLGEIRLVETPHLRLPVVFLAKPRRSPAEADRRGRPSEAGQNRP